jgi:hypothetical protein
VAEAEAEAEELVWGQAAVLVVEPKAVVLIEDLAESAVVWKAAEPETRYLIP